MIIWFALIIPVLTVFAMAYMWRHKITWAEMFLPIGVSILLIGCSKFFSEMYQTRDIEYWNSYIVRATYYEDWNEKVNCRHPKYRTETRTQTYTDSSGRIRTRTYTEQVFDGYMHAYDVDYHPPRWIAYTNIDEEISISSQAWSKYAEIFGNQSFRELNRNFFTKDGNAHDTFWDNKFETLQHVVTKHSYENRVQASNSIFNYRDLTKEEKSLVYDYPRGGYFDTPSVLPVGWSGSNHIDKMNALIGSDEEIRVWILIFRDQNREVAKLQEAHWKGGNKNELVICVGVTGQNDVQWAEVFSWTKKEDLKISIRDYIQDQKQLNLITLRPWLTSEIQSKWERRDFQEFSYLEVSPPSWFIILVYILTLIASIGSAVYVIKNEINPQNDEE